MPRKSDFLLILVPTDESALEVVVEEHASAVEMQAALEAAMAKGCWRDVIGIYRHHGTGPLDDKWWCGPSTIYGRHFANNKAHNTSEG